MSDELPFACEDVFIEDGVSEDDYTKYRGKCQEMAQALVDADPSLTLVRGHYYDSLWGMQAHWWTKKPDGTIVDPTKDQFPSKGTGVYEEFDGYCVCDECGTRVKEEDAVIIGNGHYAMCSDRCAFLFVGLDPPTETQA